MVGTWVRNGGLYGYLNVCMYIYIYIFIFIFISISWRYEIFDVNKTGVTMGCIYAKLCMWQQWFWAMDVFENAWCHHSRLLFRRGNGFKTTCACWKHWPSQEWARWKQEAQAIIKLHQCRRNVGNIGISRLNKAAPNLLVTKWRTPKAPTTTWLDGGPLALLPY